MNAQLEMLVDEIKREVFDMRGMNKTKAEELADKLGLVFGVTLRKRNLYHSGDVVYHPKLNVYRVYSGNVKTSGYYKYNYIEIPAEVHPIELLFKLWNINGVIEYGRGTYVRITLNDAKSLKTLMKKFNTDGDERHNDAPSISDLIAQSENVVWYGGYLILPPRKDSRISIDTVAVKYDGLFEFIRSVDAGEPDSMYCNEESDAVVIWWD